MERRLLDEFSGLHKNLRKEVLESVQTEMDKLVSGLTDLGEPASPRCQQQLKFEPSGQTMNLEDDGPAHNVERLYNMENHLWQSIQTESAQPNGHRPHAAGRMRTGRGAMAGLYGDFSESDAAYA